MIAGPRPAHRPGALWLCGVLAALAARATDLTVRANTPSGAPATDAVIVLEPFDAAPPAARGGAVIDQINKRFVPHVSVIRTGTAVTFPNSDNIRHQVYSLSEPKTFTLKLYAGSPKTQIVFDKPGLVALGCNIHDTMVAFLLVVDSPYFAKIPESGSATLDLPAGRYHLRTWHEKLAAPAESRDIIVGSTPLSLALTLDLDPARELVAPWP